MVPQLTHAFRDLRRLLALLIEPRPEFGAMNSPLPRCEACEAIATPSEPDSYAELDLYTDPSDVDAHKPLPANAAHRLDSEGVLAVYRLSERIPCSMPGRHPHAEGLVVRARCGIVLNIGSDCGRKHIEGFAAIDAYASQAREYHSFLGEVRAQIIAQRARVAVIDESISRLFAFRRWLAGCAPALEAHLRNRWLERSSLRPAEVPRGVELWNYQQRDASRERSDLRSLELELDAWTEKLPPLNEQRRHRGRVKDLRERLDALEMWIRAASMMATQDGMNLAIVGFDSKWQVVDRVAFDARTGQQTTRKDEVFTRVFHRYDVDASGIIDMETGEAFPVTWA